VLFLTKTRLSSPSQGGTAIISGVSQMAENYDPNSVPVFSFAFSDACVGPGFAGKITFGAVLEHRRGWIYLASRLGSSGIDSSPSTALTYYCAHNYRAFGPEEPRKRSWILPVER